jgi:hypothetical protein
MPVLAAKGMDIGFGGCQPPRLRVGWGHELGVGTDDGDKMVQ